MSTRTYVLDPITIIIFVVCPHSLNTPVLTVTLRVLPPCIVIIVALAIAGGGQGDGVPLPTHNVSSFLLTITSIAAPGSVVLIVEFLGTVATGAETLWTCTILTTPYTLTMATSIITKYVVNTQCNH